MMETKIFAVSGMMCDACAGHVTRALTALYGVQSVDVDLAGASAAVTYDSARAGLRQMQAAVEDEGYELKNTN